MNIDYRYTESKEFKEYRCNTKNGIFTCNQLLLKGQNINGLIEIKCSKCSRLKIIKKDRVK